MIKEGTDILRMQLHISHIPSNAGRPHFQKTKKLYKQEKAPNANPKPSLPTLFITWFICQPLLSKSFFKKTLSKETVNYKLSSKFSATVKVSFFKKF